MFTQSSSDDVKITSERASEGASEVFEGTDWGSEDVELWTEADGRGRGRS